MRRWKIGFFCLTALLLFCVLSTAQAYTQQDVNNKVKEIVAEVIHDGMSDYDKALALHNYLCEHANYDYTFSNYGADGVLLKGTGVCQSYTDAYGLLLDAVGIANYAEIGPDHTWNVVCLDGAWCHIDVTWDDGSVGWDYDFFAVTDYALRGVLNHDPRSNNYVTCNSYWMSAAYNDGTLSRIVDGWKAQIINQLSKQEANFVISGRFGYAYGIAPRMAFEMLCDEEFFVHGAIEKLDLSMDCDMEGGTYALYVKRENGYDLTVAINESNFPDAVFRSYVSGSFDSNHDGILNQIEIANVLEIDCGGMGIYDLTGIEYFFL